MKLIQKTNWHFLWISLSALVIGSIVQYFIVYHIIDSETNQALLKEKSSVIKFLQQVGEIPASLYLPESDIFIEPTTSLQPQTIVTDTLLYDSFVEKNVNCHVLTFSTGLQDRFYQITVVKTHPKDTTLVKAIALPVIGLYSLLIIIYNLAMMRISHRLWLPFYQILSTIKSFDFQKKTELKFPATTTSEFQDLQQVAAKLISDLESSYFNMKKLNEDIAHEIQNPLAIIRTKVELLLQKDDLNDEETKLLSQINKANTRLYKLNQSLLLIAKIRNLQFPETRSISIKESIEHKLADYEEHIHYKNIKVTVDGESDVCLKINEFLLESLLDNLLSNAIKYNQQNGQLIIQIDPGRVSFINTGGPLPFPEEDIFQRFHHTNNQTTGLGLSIVSQICQHYGFRLSYEYQNNLHHFIVAI